MEPLLVEQRDYGDGLAWWNMAFAAGYPDWMIRSPLPDPDPGQRWVWTGRAFCPLPEELYEKWIQAHWQPISHAALYEMLRPYAEGPGKPLRDLVRAYLRAGAFVSWPWGMQDLEDTPEAIGVVPNPISDSVFVPNPLPGVIPDTTWLSGMRMDHMASIWKEARARDMLPGGLFDTVQDLLREKRAWLVAQPVRGLEI